VKSSVKGKPTGLGWLVTLALGWPLIGLVKVYQWTIRPLIGPRCRFYPGCSQYMIDAILKYGPVRGVWKGMGRIVRCHPWHPGGYDPP
jgi:uncharacterized protein